MHGIDTDDDEINDLIDTATWLAKILQLALTSGLDNYDLAIPGVQETNSGTDQSPQVTHSHCLQRGGGDSHTPQDVPDRVVRNC